MGIHVVRGNSWRLRATEIYSCNKCGFEQVFPRYGETRKLAVTRLGRCSKWSLLFGAILSSISIKTRLVHDFLDHCWNESLINENWLHIDSTLEFPISFNHHLYYEQCWGKKFQSILAFSHDSLEDVTMIYSEQQDNVLKRRNQENAIGEFKKIYSKVWIWTWPIVTNKSSFAYFNLQFPIP
jgi:hypothetical protein